MSLVNLKLVASVLLEERLKAIESGEIKLGFANQHEATVIEGALEAIAENSEAVEEYYNRVGKNGLNPVDFAANNIVDFAHSVSNFEPEDFSSAWVD